MARNNTLGAVSSSTLQVWPLWDMTIGWVVYVNMHKYCYKIIFLVMNKNPYLGGILPEGPTKGHSVHFSVWQGSNTHSIVFKDIRQWLQKNFWGRLCCLCNMQGYIFSTYLAQFFSTIDQETSRQVRSLPVLRDIPNLLQRPRSTWQQVWARKRHEYSQVHQ